MARLGIEPRTSDIESGALPTVLRGPAMSIRLRNKHLVQNVESVNLVQNVESVNFFWKFFSLQ